MLGGYCPPGTPKQRLQFDTAIFISVFPTSLLIFGITLNRVRKQISTFGGWKNLFRNLLITIIISGILTALPVIIFWNKPLVFSGPLLGPVIGALVSSYLFSRQKLFLFFFFSLSLYLPLFLIVWILIYIANTIFRYILLSSPEYSSPWNLALNYPS